MGRDQPHEACKKNVQGRCGKGKDGTVESKYFVFVQDLDIDVVWFALPNVIPCDTDTLDLPIFV